LVLGTCHSRGRKLCSCLRRKSILRICASGQLHVARSLSLSLACVIQTSAYSSDKKRGGIDRTGTSEWIVRVLGGQLVVFLEACIGKPSSPCASRRGWCLSSRIHNNSTFPIPHARAHTSVSVYCYKLANTIDAGRKRTDGRTDVGPAKRVRSHIHTYYPRIQSHTCRKLRSAPSIASRLPLLSIQTRIPALACYGSGQNPRRTPARTARATPGGDEGVATVITLLLSARVQL
jgi:hypothetical protein